jgi:hypothetical protein
MQQYLTALFILRKLQHLDLEVLQMRELETGSFVLRYISKNGKLIPWTEIRGRVFELPSSPNDSATGYRNLLKILLGSEIPGTENWIHDLIKNCNLSNLEFRKLDLSGCEFQGSRLDSVTFLDCNLKGANLSGCHFKSTAFAGDCDLTQASTKDAILESIRDDKGNILGDLKEIREFFFERTQLPSERREPCQAVINLRKVLEKVVRKGKGMRIPKKFVTQTKCGGTISASLCIQEALRHSILSQEGQYVKVRVTAFEGVREFTLKPSKSTMTEAIGKVLDGICPDTSAGCKHTIQRASVLPLLSVTPSAPNSSQVHLGHQVRSNEQR